MSNHTDTLYQNGSATRWCCNHVKRKYRGIIEPSVPYEGSILKKQYNIQTRKEIKTMFHSILCRFLSAFWKIYWQISMCDFVFFQTWQLKTTQLPNETNFVWKKTHILRRSFINYIIKTPFKYFNCKINPFSGIFINNKLGNHGIYGNCDF